MEKADLHVHSHYSDGHYSPEQLVIMAKEKGIRCIALSDHDTCAGNKELIAAGEKHGVEVIPGIEISSSRGDIVGLFVDSTAPRIRKLIADQAEKDMMRVLGSIRNLDAAGFDVTYEEVRKKFPLPVLTVQHLVEVCIDKGFADDFHSFYKNFAPGGKYRVEVDRPTPEESIEAIRDSGGAAIFAHPWLDDYDYLFDNIESLKKAGLIAIEDETSHFRPETFEPVTKTVRQVCKEHDLLITRGSDFHFEEVGAPLGEVFCDYSVVEQIKKRIGKD